MFLDTERLAQELYDASLVAQEVSLAEILPMLSRATPGHETIDEPEMYRWFLIPAFPVKTFGITLSALMKDAGDRASQEQFQHDRIVELLKKGAPVWPAFVTADGIVVDGYHRIAAHRTLRDKSMPVVIAVKQPKFGGTHWDESWRRAFPAPGKLPSWLVEILAFADREKLDLSLRRALVSPWDIQVEERVDPSIVRRMIAAIRGAGGRWPDALPLPVVVRGATMTLLDGSHRTVAARHEQLAKIPVLTVDPKAYWEIKSKFDVPGFEYVHEILPKIDLLARENEEKDPEAGFPRDRSLEAYEVTPGSLDRE